MDKTDLPAARPRGNWRAPFTGLAKVFAIVSGVGSAFVLLLGRQFESRSFEEGRRWMGMVDAAEMVSLYALMAMIITILIAPSESRAKATVPVAITIVLAFAAIFLMATGGPGFKR